MSRLPVQPPRPSSRYISTPKAFVDETNHFYPIGPLQFEKFRNGEDNYGRTDYYRDPRALKIISQDQWSKDRPLYDIQAPDQPVAKERQDFFVGAQRTLNYVRRMVPHVFGWFAMSSAWIIIIAHLEWAKHDIAQITDRKIPDWVNAVVSSLDVQPAQSLAVHLSALPSLADLRHGDHLFVVRVRK